MREIGRALLWVTVAAIAVVALVAGLLAYQLGQLYPDEGEGRRAAEAVETDLLERYSGQLRIEVSSHHPFGEVAVELSPATGDLADVDLEDVLGTLAGHAAELEGSDWRLVPQISGDWNGRSVVVHGVDGAHWPRLKGMLADGISDWREVAFDLDVPGIIVGREFRESYCGPGVAAVWREFHGDLLDATLETLHELPELPDGGAPELTTWGSACGDTSRLRYSVELGADGPRQRIGDLREIVVGLPDEVVLSMLRLDGRDVLNMEVHRADGSDLPASEVEELGRRLDALWTHGDVLVNGHAAGEP